MPRRIYIASSWRNPYQPEVVRNLSLDGHRVYDFRRPPHRLGGFAWSDVDPSYTTWTAIQYRERLLSSPVASHGFVADLRAMRQADTGVLVLPAGRSAHLELGWLSGAGKLTVIYMPDDGEPPELMNLLADHISTTLNDLRDFLLT